MGEREGEGQVPWILCARLGCGEHDCQIQRCSFDPLASSVFGWQIVFDTHWLCTAAQMQIGYSGHPWGCVEVVDAVSQPIPINLHLHTIKPTFKRGFPIMLVCIRHKA